MRYLKRVFLRNLSVCGKVFNFHLLRQFYRLSLLSWFSPSIDKSNGQDFPLHQPWSCKFSCVSQTWERERERVFMPQQQLPHPLFHRKRREEKVDELFRVRQWRASSRQESRGETSFPWKGKHELQILSSSLQRRECEQKRKSLGTMRTLDLTFILVFSPLLSSSPFFCSTPMFSVRSRVEEKGKNREWEKGSLGSWDDNNLVSRVPKAMDTFDCLDEKLLLLLPSQVWGQVLLPVFFLSFSSRIQETQDSNLCDRKTFSREKKKLPSLWEREIRDTSWRSVSVQTVNEEEEATLTTISVTKKLLSRVCCFSVTSMTSRAIQEWVPFSLSFFASTSSSSQDTILSVNPVCFSHFESERESKRVQSEGYFLKRKECFKKFWSSTPRADDDVVSKWSKWQFVPFRHFRQDQSSVGECVLFTLKNTRLFTVLKLVHLVRDSSSLKTTTKSSILDRRCWTKSRTEKSSSSFPFGKFLTTKHCRFLFLKSSSLHSHLICNRPVNSKCSFRFLSFYATAFVINSIIIRDFNWSNKLPSTLPWRNRCTVPLVMSLKTFLWVSWLPSKWITSLQEHWGT